MVKILIEGEFPAITDAFADFDCTRYLGHRFMLDSGGEKSSAVLLETSDAPENRRITLSEDFFRHSYPVLNPDALRSARAVAEYYLAEFADVLALMLPPSPRRKVLPLPEKTQDRAFTPGAINDKQAEIIRTIQETPASAYAEHLIWGVTGSGKTRVYEHLIATALARGEQTLLLVPEIALSSQVMDVIAARFPGETVLYHSGLSDSERLANYRAFLTGNAGIAVGTRSAIFLPAHNLAQIIVDEEHDASFKDQRKIRFDTRTVARLRQITQPQLKLILGSATPSLESLGRAKTGAAKLYRMRGRATGQNMPDVFVPEYRFQHGIISPFLAAKMHEHLNAGNQVLLLMNRRGHSTHVHCPTCEARAAEGHAPGGYAECPRCSVALTYHKNGTLRCHYCGYSEQFSPVCPKDGAERRLSGRGIQRVEEILDAQFGGYEYARLDRDTARTKNFTGEVIAAMRAGKIRILIGTQMIAKGFDIEGVTLVGVLAIDQTLASPDFRAGESAWQLLAQVTGRSGRHKPGEVVIQTMTPKHPAIRAAAEHDPDTFYAAEAAYRQLTEYPPFGFLARLVLIGDSEAQVFAAAEKLSVAIRPENSADMFAAGINPISLLGPAVPSLARIDNEFRVHFLVKSREEKPLLAYLKAVRSALDRLERQVKGLRIILDIDPRETA
ncbi:MAG: primosomal protein N' [Turneriella sp.]|nr:primosomal protein N' [Turneriella sp.]